MPQRTKVILSPEQLQMERDIKRLNERINEIAKAYGTNSYSYNKYYSAIVANVPAKFRRTSKHGIIQISRSKEYLQTATSPKTARTMSRLLGLKTKGQLRQSAKKSLLDENVEKLTAKQIEQRMKEIDEINIFIEENQDMFYVENYSDTTQKALAVKGRKKTYGELYQIVDEYKKMDKKKYKDMFEGM